MSVRLHLIPLTNISSLLLLLGATAHRMQGLEIDLLERHAEPARRATLTRLSGGHL